MSSSCLLLLIDDAKISKEMQTSRGISLFKGRDSPIFCNFAAELIKREER
jgi:hypothetical protein